MEATRKLWMVVLAVALGVVFYAACLPAFA